MNKINYKIYLLSMIESLIYGKNQTDLGDYVLEYKYHFSEIGGGDMYDGDACLANAVRLRNKTSGLIEWGNIYHKRLILNSNAVSTEEIQKLTKKYKEICKSSKEEKVDFILRPETKILKRPYAHSDFIDPTISPFFRNLNGSAYDGYPTVALGGSFPKEAISCLEKAFIDIIQTEEVLFKGIVQKLGYTGRAIDRSKSTEESKYTGNITFKQIGRRTTKTFSSNPQKAINTISTLKTRAKTIEEIDKDQTQIEK